MNWEDEEEEEKEERRKMSRERRIARRQRDEARIAPEGEGVGRAEPGRLDRVDHIAPTRCAAAAVEAVASAEVRWLRSPYVERCRHCARNLKPQGTSG